MNLTTLRTAVATALDTVDPDTVVHSAPVDAVQPPCYVLQWADPWLTPASWCQSFAALEVIAVAARLEPDAQYETLETLITGAYAALNTARLTPTTTSTPLPLEIGSVTYLTARLAVREPVDIPAAQTRRT